MFTGSTKAESHCPTIPSEPTLLRGIGIGILGTQVPVGGGMFLEIASLQGKDFSFFN